MDQYLCRESDKLQHSICESAKWQHHSGHFEIVSLTGTLSINGSHIHLSVSDSTGKTIGGHLMDGCKVYTTAEIVILSSNQYEFKRAKDASTPWEELQVEEQ